MKNLLQIFQRSLKMSDYELTPEFLLYVQEKKLQRSLQQERSDIVKSYSDSATYVLEEVIENFKKKYGEKYQETKLYFDMETHYGAIEYFQLCFECWYFESEDDFFERAWKSYQRFLKSKQNSIKQKRKETNVD